MNMCDNAVPTDRWPFTKICRSTKGTKLRLVCVGYKAGTWDPIWEQHDLCTSCADRVVLANDKNNSIPYCPHCDGKRGLQIMLVNQAHDFRCELCGAEYNWEHVEGD